MPSRSVAEAWFFGAVRSPMGKQDGALSPVRPDDLTVLTSEALVQRIGAPPRR